MDSFLDLATATLFVSSSEGPSCDSIGSCERKGWWFDGKAMVDGLEEFESWRSGLSGRPHTEGEATVDLSSFEEAIRGLGSAVSAFGVASDVDAGEAALDAPMAAVAAD